MNPHVLIVVLNYNKKALVLECLESIREQTYQPCSVVVVDNASTDSSQQAIRERHPDFNLLCNKENLGPAGGRNAGVAHARGRFHFDYILFLDDDAEVSQDAISELVLALEDDPSAGLACGKTYVALGDSTLMAAGAVEKFHFARCYDRGAGELDTGQYDQRCYVDACGGFAFLIRAQVLEILGGFDPIFHPYGFEDFDLCLRARALGYRTLYVPTARLAHKGTRLGRPPRAGYERAKVTNFLKLARRHMSMTQKLSAVFFVPLQALLLFARFIRVGQWRMIPSHLRGAWDYLANRRSR